VNKLWLGIWVLAISLAQTELSPEVFEIARELRCPICAGESAAESDTGLAREMRRTIAEQLAQGKSEAEIKDFFVQRYGEWILLEPPSQGAGVWLWIAPLGFALLIAGLGFAYLLRVGRAKP
jgi:cytochrome c-type biogenesis protein CcmH